VAILHAALEEKDKAFTLLETACEARYAWTVFLNVDPMADGLRSDPRFADLVQRIGLAP
jgi:hypothetical protein